MILSPLRRSVTVLSKYPRAQLSSSALNEWISQPKEALQVDTLHPERLAELYITLPTRDGIRKPPFEAPHLSQPLGHGHHMAFFPSLTPESLLRPDGTDGDFCPPGPFNRRMYAGGKMRWNWNSPLLVGERVEAKLTVDAVQKKGFEQGKNPMIFVDKKVEYTMVGKAHPSLVEHKNHVYLSKPLEKTGPRAVKGLPSTKDFSFSFTPTLTTLFRFSALTWNAHQIHLDKDFAVNHEGYTERLVHGPLTALMLLEGLMYHHPTIRLGEYEYRATNPLVVGRPLAFNGHRADDGSFTLWCEDELDETVGMTAWAKPV